MITLDEACRNLQQFIQGSLKTSISTLEVDLQRSDKTKCQTLYVSQQIDTSLLSSALVLKKAAKQIHEIVHALGILLALPHILLDGEEVEKLSLAAGNKGRDFDLETNYRVAEFKFAQWNGHDSMRKKQLFKDFYALCEYPGNKKRNLYLVGRKHQIDFLDSTSTLDSVMSRHSKLLAKFHKQHDSTFYTVGEYFRIHQANVEIIDLLEIVPEFSSEFGAVFTD
jgi:hypothetical protein